MLKDKIQEDMKAAMKTQDGEKLSTLRMLKSALQYAEIAKGLNYTATDEDVLDVIGKEVKKHKEAIELYEKGGRPELADKEKKELEILQTYLPEQMSEDEIQTLVEEVGVFMLKHAQENFPEVLNEFNVKPVAFGKIPRLTLREAQEIIFKEFGRDSRHEKDLAPQDEVDICKWAFENNGSDLVTITHFPTLKRAFYTKPDPEDPEYSLSYDLLFRGVEVLSGSLRINNYEDLVTTIKDRGMDPLNFELYLQAFKYGMPPEGGLSFGLERMTMNILQLKNIREATLFPRDMERVDIRFSATHEEIQKETA